MPKRNEVHNTRFQTQGWANLSYKLDRVREAAEQDKRLRFTTLLHHITRHFLLDSYMRLRKDAACGVDEVTWREYQHGLVGHLFDLRIHSNG